MLYVLRGELKLIFFSFQKAKGSSRLKTPSASKTQSVKGTLKTPRTPATPKTPSATFPAPDSTPKVGLVSTNGASREPGSFTYENLSWLSEEKRKYVTLSSTGH